MLTAVVDTNIVVAGVLANNSKSASFQVIDHVLAGAIELILSTDAIAEIEHVLGLPKLQAIHQFSDDKIRRFCQSLIGRSRILPGTTKVSATLTRDISDTKWIALAIEGDADYLVTHDMRHLHRLKKVGRTKIVTAHAFLQVLS